MTTKIDDSVLLHYSKGYDPVKAREYYLRTRKLKGRSKGEQEEPKVRTRSGASQTPALKPKRTASAPSVTEAQIAALKGRLAKLQSVLEKLVAEAKEDKEDSSSSSKSSSSSSSSKSSKSGGGSKKRELTTQQKKEAAQRSKEWREKNEEPSSKSSSSSDNSRSISEVKAQIRIVRANLKVALERARKNSQSKTASKGR